MIEKPSLFSDLLAVVSMMSSFPANAPAGLDRPDLALVGLELCVNLCPAFLRLETIEVIMETPKTLAPAQIEMLGQGRHFDPAVPGLCLKVGDKGRRTWCYRRRVARAKTIITKQLGAFPAFSIAAARQWAMELNEATERGENPLATLRAEAARTAMTLDRAHQAYIVAITRGDRKKLRPRTISDKQGKRSCRSSRYVSQR